MSEVHAIPSHPAVKPKPSKQGLYRSGSLVKTNGSNSFGDSSGGASALGQANGSSSTSMGGAGNFGAAGTSASALGKANGSNSVRQTNGSNSTSLGGAGNARAEGDAGPAMGSVQTCKPPPPLGRLLIFRESPESAWHVTKSVAEMA